MKQEIIERLKKRYLLKLGSRIEGGAAKKAEWGNRQLMNEIENFSVSDISMEDVINGLDVMIQVAFPDEDNGMRKELLDELNQYRVKK